MQKNNFEGIKSKSVETRTPSVGMSRGHASRALDSAAVLDASLSYFFIGGILYLFCASAILSQSRCEDLPINFMQMECHRQKGCSDFPVQEMPLPSIFYLSFGTLHAITFPNNPGYIFLLHVLEKPKYLMFKL